MLENPSLRLRAQAAPPYLGGAKTATGKNSRTRAKKAGERLRGVMSRMRALK